MKIKINPDEIETKLRKFQETSAGKQKIRLKKRELVNTYGSSIIGLNHEAIGGAITGFTKSFLAQARENEAFGYRFEDLFNQTPSNIFDIKTTQNTTNRMGLTTSCTIEISFKDNIKKRESLRPDLYPNGVNNIFKLLTNGWDYRSDYKRRHENIYGGIVGVWKSDTEGNFRVRAVAYNPGDDVFFKIIDRYNVIQENNKTGWKAKLSNGYIRSSNKWMAGFRH